jgi:hypothetical protein
VLRSTDIRAATIGDAHEVPLRRASARIQE